MPLASSSNPPRLAFQTLAISTNGNPPFQALAQLGGRDILRGYFLGRYRDRNLAVFQSEFRMPLTGRWGVVGYAAAGNVARHWSGMKSREFKPATGAGVRYRFSDAQKVNIRLDLTWGRETPNPSFYLSLAEAF
jgi:outer membrane translocation and assembly module TamA